MTDTKVTQVLVRAKAIVASPEAWCTGAYALDDKGIPVGIADRAATKFCLTAAITIAAQEIDPSVMRAAINRLQANLPPFYREGDAGDCIVGFNDLSGREHRQIVNALDKAIAESRTAAK